MMWKLHGGGTCSGIVNVLLNLRFTAGFFFQAKHLLGIYLIIGVGRVLEGVSNAKMLKKLIII